jgi:predicted small metal-binding protein
VADAMITVRCACGWETTGAEDDVIVATIDHGRRVHNMTATRDEVLAMAVDGSGDGPVEPRGQGGP